MWKNVQTEKECPDDRCKPNHINKQLNATNIPIKKQRLSDGIEKARLGKHTSNII